jgi:hypothetical protein
LSQEAIAGGLTLATLAGAGTGKERVSYDQVVAERRLLPPLDHPEPARFWITGTGRRTPAVPPPATRRTRRAWLHGDDDRSREDLPHGHRGRQAQAR